MAMVVFCDLCGQPIKEECVSLVVSTQMVEDNLDTSSEAKEFKTRKTKYAGQCGGNSLFALD